VKNLLSNPAWLELDDNGIPVGLGELISPSSPVGWHIYDKSGSSNGRQTIYGALPLTLTTYAQASTLASGITHPTISTAPPDAPTLPSGPAVSAVTASSTLGLAANWYGTAIAWITAAETDDGLTSLPSTRYAVELTTGQRITLAELPVLSEAPAGIYGLAILSTAGQSSEANALLATTPLYVQSVYALDSLPASAIISGPIRTDDAATLEAGPDPTDVDPAYLPDAHTATALSGSLPDLSGNHKIRVTWAFEGGAESAASPQASVTLSSSQTFQVTQPGLDVGDLEVLENPVDRPAALTGIDHNQIRYTGPTGTAQDYRIFQFAPRAVVRGGETYTVSSYIKTEDASEAELFEMAFRDQYGDLVETLDPIATLSGDNGWARYDEQYTAPDEAVFLEVYGHKVGEGVITITPPQIEAGSSVTTFDDGTIPSGHSGYIIVAWETQPVEHESFFGLPTGYSTAAVEIDDSDGFDYTVSYASSDESPEDDSPDTWTFFEDIGDVPFRDFLAAKIEIEAP
jgi:hypothetical protein